MYFLVKPLVNRNFRILYLHFTFLEPETATCKITGDICCKEESISTVSTTTTTEFTPSDKCEDYSKFGFKCAKETECLDEGFK